MNITALASIGDRLARSRDPHFRARTAHEYGTVARYVGIDALRGARIYDFGCGEGIAAASFALRHADSQVFGTDIVPIRSEFLRDKFATQVNADLPTNLDLRQAGPSTVPAHITDLDVIYSWSVFEHIARPDLHDVLTLLRERLKSGGKFFLQIDPLYFSSRGAHLYGVIAEPWSHLIHQTDILHGMLFESQNSETSKHRLWEQYRTLNRATADDIVDVCIAAGFRVLKREVRREEIDPPAHLLRAYTREALTTSELRLLLTH